MAYTDKKTTPKKWHRFRQILIMPVMILGLLYCAACFVIEYFRLNVDGLFNLVEKVLEKLSIDIHAAGDTQMILLIVFGSIVVFFLMELISWLKSFRWKKASLVFGILITLVLFAGAGAAIYVLIGMNYAESIAALASSVFNKRIQALAVKIIGGVFFGLIALYAILNFFYYIKRRNLYGRRKDEDDDIPFIEETEQEEKKRGRRKKEEPKKEERPEPILEDVRKSDDLLSEGTEEIEQTAAVLGLKFCTNCGTRLNKDDLAMTYCKYCGKKFEKK